MIKPAFTEVIKILDGKIYNLPMHKERVFNTSKAFFGNGLILDLSENAIPFQFRTGLIKCRIVYSSTIEHIEYQCYHFRQINSLCLIESDTIDYSYKSLDRSAIASLFSQRQDCDDILIVKSGLLTDTSYSNIVLEHREDGLLYTPALPLLNGTKRRQLIKQDRINEADISADDIENYSQLYLINAMIDIEDNICVDVNNIVKLPD